MKTIVVLGVGVAAAPIIRQIMRTVVLPGDDFKMIVVAPNSHFLWPIAMPRVVVPGQLADEKVMFDLWSIFKEYPSSKFEFVLGRASMLDPSGRRVTVELNDSGTRALAYHTLVVATGSTARDDMPWKVLDTAEKTTLKLHNLQDDIRRARTIVVAGGGATGTETAGELGFEYARKGDKEVYFVHSQDLPLSPPVLPSVRRQTKAELEKLGVKLVANTTVTSAVRSAPGGDTVLELRSADGSTRRLTAQAYIPATGATPNTAFAPSSMLDNASRFRQTTRLTAEGHDDIFIVGDAGNLQPATAVAAEAQSKHLIKALPLHLRGAAPDALPEYKPATTNMAMVTLGRSRGVGHFGGFKLFSFMVYMAKGRFLGTDYAPALAMGKRTMMTTFEK